MELHSHAQWVRDHLRPSGLLWHATPPRSYRQILRRGEIVHDATKSRVVRPACRQLGAISVFDFSGPSDLEFENYSMPWALWLSDAPNGVFVLIGFCPDATGKLIRYPATRDLTPNCQGPFPHVEVCHFGAVSVARFRRVLLFRPFNLASLALENSELASFESALRAFTSGDTAQQN
jgi:hypothetical protein